MKVHQNGLSCMTRWCVASIRYDANTRAGVVFGDVPAKIGGRFSGYLESGIVGTCEDKKPAVRRVVTVDMQTSP